MRVVKIDGEPWFVAKDVAELLGYSNPLDAIAKHCKSVSKDGFAIRDSIGRMQKTPIIPERDVYRLVMRSKLPAAERFEEWVVGTVLPAIRKDGAYVMGEEKVASGELEETQFILRAFQMLNAKAERLAGEVVKLTAEKRAITAEKGHESSVRQLSPDD